MDCTNHLETLAFYYIIDTELSESVVRPAGWELGHAERKLYRNKIGQGPIHAVLEKDRIIMNSRHSHGGKEMGRVAACPMKLKIFK